MLRDLGIQGFNIADVRSVAEGYTRHLVRMPTRQVDKVFEDAAVKTRRKTSKMLDSESSVWFDSEGCDVCRTILGNSSFLISGRNLEGDTIIYSFVTPSFEAFKRILSTLEDRGLQPKILELGQFKPRGKILTEKQERALWFAVKMGFFDYPRKITMEELSHRLGVSLSTLSEVSRRGIRRLLQNHFKK